jgi:hypothetical protein
MNAIKRIVMMLAVAAGGVWLVVPASAALTACGGSSGGGTGGGSGGGSGTDAGTGGGSGSDCFTGTPSTNDQFLNACVDQSIEKILRQTSWRAAGVTLPPLP